MLNDIQLRIGRTVGVLASVVILLVSEQILQACWVAISLEDFVKDNHVIVVGEIQRVTSAPKSQYSYDTAFIKVERILRRWLPSPELSVGGEIPLSMPAASNERRISTDIFYANGQRGVWILHFHDGKYFAGHPMSLQALIDEPKIAAIVRNQAKQKVTSVKFNKK